MFHARNIVGENKLTQEVQRDANNAILDRLFHKPITRNKEIADEEEQSAPQQTSTRMVVIDDRQTKRSIRKRHHHANQRTISQHWNAQL